MRVIPVLASAALLLSVSCKLNTDYFSEYRDVNLLGNYDLGAVEASGAAQWKLATDSAFMVWEPVSDADRPTEATYRLEIRNLIPNGDFEDASLTADGQNTLPTGWKTTYFDGTAPDNPAVIRFGPSPSPTVHTATINGSRALGWDSGGSGNQLRVLVSDLVTTADASAWRAIGYLFRVDAVNVGNAASVAMTLYDDAGNHIPENTLYSSLDWTQNTLNAAGSTDNTTVYSIVRPFLLGDATSVRTVSFGPNGATGTYAAVLDNVRLLPRGETLAVQASLPSLSSGTKELLPGSKPGMYLFTVDVKNDPSAGAGNHFAASDFTVELEASVKSGSRKQVVTVPAPSGGWPTWTTIQVKAGFDFVNSDADHRGQPALRISLSPTKSNIGDADVGTVLVSRPVLTFNP